jgi:quinoprotein glucose dehydrogenase
MGRTITRLATACGLLAAAVWVMPTLSGQQRMPSTANGEWPMITASLDGSRYSPLDQINASNFKNLEVAWTFSTDNLGPRSENKLEGTPIMVNGTLYATGGTSRSVVALDPATGQLLWTYHLDEGERATRWAPRQLSGRGLSYWTDGRGDERIIYVTIGYRLVELNAKTGRPVETFGEHGIVDLKIGAYIGNNKQVDLEKGEIGLHSTPTVVNDTVIVGSSMFEGLGYRYSTNVKGVARAFDVRTGKQLWRFDTIPKPGEFGNETWEEGSWEYSGNTGVWTQISVDPVANLVYLPVETPTIDEYGGNRPGNNLFAESIVAVDLRTGQRKWYFQQVHHGLWDHDNSSASLLIDATVNGQPRKLLAQPTKQGWLYVFDRITGEPIWPIPETPVPQTDIPGEKTSPTQPIPSNPPPYSRTFVSRDDIVDFTPAIHQQALDNLSHYRWEQSPFVPPTGPDSKWAGAINIGNTGGGVNWPGASFDPETGIAYMAASNSGVAVGDFDKEEFEQIRVENQTQPRKPRWEADPNYGLPSARGAAPAGRGAAPVGRGAAPAAFPGGRAGLSVGLQGLPIVKPPYGVLSAIDLKAPKLLFQVPNGDTPDNIKNNPLLKGLDIPKTGQNGAVAPLITQTLAIVGQPQETTQPNGERAGKLWAYDKNTGAVVGSVLMPAHQSGSPMTYSVNGKQYIVVAVSGNGLGGTYVAYALP